MVEEVARGNSSRGPLLALPQSPAGYHGERGNREKLGRGSALRAMEDAKPMAVAQNNTEEPRREVREKNLIAPFGRPKKNQTLRRFAPTDEPSPVDDGVIESLRNA